MKLDEQVVLAALVHHPPNRSLHPSNDCLGCEDAARSCAGWARLRHALVVTLPNALARHLDQSQIADRERLRAGAIAGEMIPQLLKNLVARLLRLHVDEVAH